MATSTHAYGIGETKGRDGQNLNKGDIFWRENIVPPGRGRLTSGITHPDWILSKIIGINNLKKFKINN
jgi:hypothetical protein